MARAEPLLIKRKPRWTFDRDHCRRLARTMRATMIRPSNTAESLVRGHHAALHGEDTVRVTDRHTRTAAAAMNSCRRAANGGYEHEIAP
jgi:hypothetical protein